MLALIVDDSRALRALMGRALRDLGFRVVEARHGAEGLDRLRESAGVAVALVDWNMPVMDGIEFVRSVRRRPEFAALRLMMVSTESDAERVALALAEGADSYVTKPFTADDLARGLERLGLSPARARDRRPVADPPVRPSSTLPPDPRPEQDRPMREIRVLIIDDAAAERRLIAAALASVPGLAVVGSAANGRIGLEMIPVVRPDVVVLDLVMPEMDGFQVLASLRATDPGLPVVVLSGSPRRRSQAMLDALALGGIDYVSKPSAAQGADAALRSIVAEMSPRIVALGASAATRADDGGRGSARADPAELGPRVVVVGVSTGGPDALAALLPALPADFPAPILIVQHMPAHFIGPLARRLDARSALSVAEAVDGQVVAPGQVVIAPGGRHLVARRQGRDVLVATQFGPAENSCCPSADVLFRSAARQFGAATLGVVMTGMGQDGLLGAGEIRRAGGRILAQDRPSSVVWGMPGHVADAGLADRLLPPDQLAAEIARRARGGAPGRPPA